MVNYLNYTLSDGFKIPSVGLGTSGLKGINGQRIIEMALDAGYRLVDSAFNYENEGVVGAAIRKSSVPREQITVTSKLPGRHHRYDQALLTIQESVLRMGLDYIDLYLIHWPNPLENKYVEAWQALIDARKSGLVRSIGVSNFLPEHTSRLEKETGILPVINQIELHPFFNQQIQRTFDHSKSIITEAWSPIGRGTDLKNHPTIYQIAEKYHKSCVQIILRWDLQNGVIPLPKSSNIARLEENLAIFDFELSNEDMATINNLSSNEGRMFNQDPATYQEF